MLMEIKTDLGTFGDFRDIETFMRLEGHDKVKVICIKVIFKTLDGFVGEYTYNEIKQVIGDMEGELK